MKIRSVELTNFRKFVGTIRVDAIGDNVNVLVGRNEHKLRRLLDDFRWGRMDDIFLGSSSRSPAPASALTA